MSNQDPQNPFQPPSASSSESAVEPSGFATPEQSGYSVPQPQYPAPETYSAPAPPAPETYSAPVTPAYSEPQPLQNVPQPYQQSPVQSYQAPPAPQPYQQPYQPSYATPGADVHDSVGSWMLAIFLVGIPIVNFIYLLVIAFGGTASIARRNWARATFAWMLIGIALTIIFWLVVGAGGFALFNNV